ncbi:MAG: hypothetical protein C4523_10675 [Myxococcales bacterium]|jgi:hypothetical protein|nr:MAG: hypothetical protein C4523_10675 [Myxococcales bacterium]
MSEPTPIAPETIAKARAELERRWDGEGYCGSCSWHAALYEHDVTDDDLAEAIRNGGRLELGCQNYEYGDPHDHRGVTIILETK